MTEKIKKLLEEARREKSVFERSMICSIVRVEDGIFSISRLTDYFHDLTLALLIDPVKYIIIDALAEMNKVPYEICRETAAGVDNLKGIFIFHPAAAREVRRAIKRKEGCTHLFELIEFTLATLFTGGPRAGLNGPQIVKIDKELKPEDQRRLQMTNPRLANTCRAFVTEE